MVGKLFWLVVFVGLGWWCNKTGVIYNLTHSLQPEPGRECQVNGPIKSGVYIAPEKADMKFPIDAKIGTPAQRLESRQTLRVIIDQAKVYELPESTKVKVIRSGFVELYKIKNPLVEISVLDGDYAGQTGWVERENVIDSPFMEAFQAMRAAAPAKRESGAASPGSALE